MSSRSPRKAAITAAEAVDPEGLAAWMLRYLATLRLKNYSAATVDSRERYLAWFLAWGRERGILRPVEVTRPILQQYQRHLFHRRKSSGDPLSFHSQHNRMRAVMDYFRWLTRQNILLSNPASDIELPRLEKRLPKHVLTAAEAEAVMAQPDVDEAFGLRDRALLETFYSTGIRRSEMSRLQLFDLDPGRGTLTIRQGKGKKDRFVPIGERATAWTRKYLEEVRPGLAVLPGEYTLFLTYLGEPFTPDGLSQLVRRYVDQAKLGKSGSCHLFRHTCATLMLDGGADIRYIQEMLGHVDLGTTQIYTRVAIQKLKEIHNATHPSARLGRAPADAEDQAAPSGAQVVGDDAKPGDRPQERPRRASKRSH